MPLEPKNSNNLLLYTTSENTYISFILSIGISFFSTFSLYNVIELFFLFNSPELKI